MNEDARAVDELITDVRDSLETSVRETEMLRDGLAAEDDPEGQGIAAVADPVQAERLSRLRIVLQTALADLP